MSIFRCAVCGSSNVFSDTKSEGYSIVKGAIGTALFGTGGAVMGVNGKSNVYYHCAKCGQTLSYTMPESVKQEIDNAIENPEVYASFLKSQKKIYPNIEWNEVIENHNNDLIRKEWYKCTAEEKAELIWEVYKKNKIPYIEESELLKALGDSDAFIDMKTMDILEKKGLMTAEYKNDKIYYTFYENVEDIKNNIDNYERKKKIEEQVKEIWQENREKLKNATIELLRKENINNEIEEKIFNKKIKELIESEIKEIDYNILCGYDELIDKISSNLKTVLWNPKNAYLVPSNNKEGYFQILLDDNERESYSKNSEKSRLEKEYSEYIEEVKKLLSKNEKMTVTEMQMESDLLCECSIQKITAI